PLTRVRPDGYTLSWVLSIPDAHGGVAPFLIEDETPRAERVPKATQHANGVTGIKGITVAVSDAALLRQWYARASGATVDGVEREELAGSGARVSIGPHQLDFVAPRGPESPLAAWLASRGASPYGAALVTSGTKAPLPLDKALGARLSLV